jgi:hypothetical protein
MSALYYYIMICNHLSHSSACFFCWPHQPELTAAFLLIAACGLVVPAAGWCLAVLARWRALVLAFSGLRASIWGPPRREQYVLTYCRAIEPIYRAKERAV